MRKLGLALIGTAALALSSAASAVTFAGTTQGCLSLTAAPCAPSNTSTLAGLTFTTGTFNQDTSASGFAAIGSGNTDTLGFFTQDGSANNYTGDFFTLLVNFTAPAGVGGGGNYFANLIGQVTGAGANNGGVQVTFTNPTQTFTYGNGQTFTLTVNNVAVSGTGALAPITGYIQAGVPEPATWAMMLLGFGGIGMAMRRRRVPALAQLA
jgi:hypothetical protein